MLMHYSNCAMRSKLNAYQTKKARAIAAVLISAALASDTSLFEAALLASRMNEEQWRSISFAAGVPVADKAARLLTVAYLLEVSK